MNGLNSCSIIGNVVRDAELKMVDVNGVQTPRCRFSVAVNETRANGEDIVTYFDVTAWREYATKIAPWVLKGRQVYVRGHVRLNTYTGAMNTMKASMQIHSPEVILLGKKPVANVEDIGDIDAIVVDEDELPFV